MGRGNSACKDLKVEQHRSWGGWSEGPGCARTLQATGKRVDFFFPLECDMEHAIHPALQRP